VYIVLGSGDVHWARLEASALVSLIAACPAWKRREAYSKLDRVKTIVSRGKINAI